MPLRRPRLKPLEQWLCDHCRRLIRRPEDGWLEWLADDDGGNSRAFRLVHHEYASPLRPGRCDIYGDLPGRGVSGRAIDELYLTDLTDRGSIPHLLTFVDPGPILEPEYRGPRLADLREWAELARRLSIPYYEEARFWMDRARADDFFKDRYPAEVYYPITLKEVILRYGE